MIFKAKRLGALVCVVAIVASLGVAAASDQKPVFESSAIVKLPGIDGNLNNVCVGPRFIFATEFLPSNGLAENAAADASADSTARDELADLDNHFLTVISKDDPTGTPKRIDLTCYYPTRIVRDESGQKIFVRATDFIRTEAGNWQSAEVVACVDLGAKDGVSPVVVKIPITAARSGNPSELRIPGTDSEWASSAPSALVSDSKGRFGVFTNGRTVTTVSLIDGRLNGVDLIAEADYSETNSISDLQFEPATGTLTAIVTGSVKPKKGPLQYVSDLHFFRLGDDGSLEPLGVVRQADLPDGASLTEGSNVVVRLQADGISQTATFVTDDGSVVSATIGPNPTVRRLGQFQELATFDGPTNGNMRGSRFLVIDPNGKWLVAGIEGTTLQIRRPTWERPGRIRRPTWISPVTESPVLAVAGLGKSGKLVGGTVYTDFGQTESSISNPAVDGDSRALFMTSSGKLLSATAGEQGLALLGQIESGMNSFDYSAAEKSVIGVRSCGMDEAGKITSEGALVIGRLDFSESAPALVAPDHLALRVFGLIRRPCGIGLFAR